MTRLPSIHWERERAVRGEGTTMAKFELYTDKRGEYRWRFRASSGQIAATGGEGYKAKHDAQAGIDRLRRDAADAPVDDITQPAES